jgi:nucleoid-associated protein YgaU
MTSSELGRLLFAVGAAGIVLGALYVAAAITVRVRRRRPSRPRPKGPGPLLSLVGSGLALAAPPAATSGRPSSFGSPTSVTEARQPYRSPKSDRFSGDPVRPHAGSHKPPAPPWSEPGGFPPPRPAGRTGEARTARPEARHENDSVHELRVPGGRMEVKPGDSLWSIAAEVLETSDPARIARYWPRIHRSNRELIGANPNLIFPGQVLELPDETPRT